MLNTLELEPTKRVSPRLALACIVMTGLALAPLSAPHAGPHDDGPTLITGDDEQTHRDIGDRTETKITPPSLSLGMRLFRRTLTFNQDVLLNLPSYEMPTAFSLHADFSWFPLSDMAESVGGRLGLAGSVHFAPGITSSTGAHGDLSTQAWGMKSGVRFDWTWGKSSIATGLSFGRDDFWLDDGQLNLVPGVSYEFLEASWAGTLHLAEPVSAFMEVGYQHLLSLGEIGSYRYFPNATGAGLRASLGVAFEVVESLEIRVAFDYQRYFLSMEPQPGDAFIAGGALDERMAGTLSVAYHFHAE